MLVVKIPLVSNYNDDIRLKISRKQFCPPIRRFTLGKMGKMQKCGCDTLTISLTQNFTSADPHFTHRPLDDLLTVVSAV